MNANMRNVWKWPPVLVMGGALVLTVFSLALGVNPNARKPDGIKPVRLEVDDRPVARNERLPGSFAPVVKKVSPSVVKVFTLTKSKVVERPGGMGFGNSWFRQFFGDEQGAFGGPRQLRTPPQRGMGSGVIVSKDGYILTNDHVVDGADEVTVSLQDGRELKAKVVGTDSKTDVAVLKVEPKDLPSIGMTDSDQIEVGDLVLAIGNPFGIGQTVTMGMVSATGRANMGLDYEDFIQTDAAINPGNSGGALVDAEGRLIGINTSILSRSGGNQGIGFAIPINLARQVMEELVSHGQVVRGYLGVIIQDVTPALAKEFNLKARAGALVGDVAPDGPADKAGLKSGDVITDYRGKSVADSRHLRLQVAATKPGDKVSLRLLRDGAPKTIEVTVKELPGEKQLARTSTRQADDNGTLNGVGVGDLDRRTRQQLELPDHLKGAVVTEVEPDSAAKAAGLQPGDVILEINRQPVRSAEDAVKLTEHAKDKTTLLRVWSRGNSHYVVVDESKAG